MPMRNYTLLNDSWSFTYHDGSVTTVNVPHTWNNIDGQDGGNDYWRGTCSYRKSFSAPAFDKENEVVYLEFRGVNASAKVVLNGKEVAGHDGGYSTFRANVTDVLTAENVSDVVSMEAQGDGSYWAQVSGIAAKKLDEPHYVAAVYTDANGNTYCTGVVAYSLSEYCVNNANGKMGALAQATAMYGYYAAQYFAN